VDFEQIDKHRPGGFGNPCIWTSDEEAARGLGQSVEIKPGMRAVQLPDGRVAIFRSAGKKPTSVTSDLWHGGWRANRHELTQIGNLPLPVFTG
jgi:hypothetical protein